MTNESNLDPFDDRLVDREYNDSVCFLCAKPLNHINKTVEHIIPKWAQKRFQLWDQELGLLNQTSIPYRYLTVPCCNECNSKDLRPLEDLVSQAIDRGVEATRNLDENVLFLWLGKILYGILYKELFLSSNLKQKNAPTIVSPEIFRKYRSYLYFLQGVRIKVKNVNFSPGSIFVFKTQKLNQSHVQWDFCDNVDTLFIGIRMGEVGVIGVLNDGGAQKLEPGFLESIQDLPLHPLQFRELCARVAYRATLENRGQTYFASMGSPHEVVQLPLGGVSQLNIHTDGHMDVSQLPFGGTRSKSLFNNWDNEAYSSYLSLYTGKSLEEVMPEKGKILTYLYDSDGNPRFMKL